MFRTIAFITLALSAVTGVILNFIAATQAGENFYSLKTLTDVRVSFLIWEQYPLAATILTALVVASGITILVTRKK